MERDENPANLQSGVLLSPLEVRMTLSLFPVPFLSGLIVGAVLLFSVNTGSLVYAAENRNRPIMEDDLIVLSVSNAFKTANKKARSLGYGLDNYYISITDKLRKIDRLFLSDSEQEHALWIFYYGPKKQTKGQDLTIYINRETLKIIRIWEGE